MKIYLYSPTNLLSNFFPFLSLNRNSMNKSTLKKALVIIVTIICIILAIYIIPRIYNIFSGIINDGFDDPVNITGNLSFTWVNIITWAIITWNSQTQTWTEVFMDVLNRDYKKTIYTLPKQPTEIPAWYTYNQRSNILINYMTENTIQLSIIKWDQAYIYIRLLRKPSFPIFIYRHWSDLWWYKRSGNLNISSALEKISATEYVFDMSKIQYSKFSDGQNTLYNWLSDINIWKSLYLALAYKWFDGNYIKEVIIFEKNK